MDVETEELVEKILTDHLKESTVIKISHKEGSLKNYGRVFEF